MWDNISEFFLTGKAKQPVADPVYISYMRKTPTQTYVGKMYPHTDDRPR